MGYQDIVINQKVIQKGYGPSCEDRYQAIKTHIFSKYNRPFTVLEIGAAYGYNAFRALGDFPLCTYIMIEYLNGLLYLCEWNTEVNDRLILLNTYADTSMLKSLAKQEHFDVIIICNLLNLLGDAYIDWIPLSLQMSSNLIIGTHQPYKIKGSKTIEGLLNFIDSLSNVQIDVIGNTPRNCEEKSLPPSPIFWIQNSNSETKRQNNITIKSSWNQKEIIKDKIGSFEWIQGISLKNFFHLQGSYPRYFESDFKEQNRDNLILSGTAYRKLPKP